MNKKTDTNTDFDTDNVPPDLTDENIPPEQDVSAEDSGTDEKTLAELAGQLLRMQADFDNFRKRVQKERADWLQRANEELAEELLPVLDHFEMGLKTAVEHQTDPAVLEGFKLVYDQLLGVLEKENVTLIDAIGKPFDPHLHEAITYVPSSSVPADSVVDQVRKGYLMGSKLLRAAQVLISSGPPA